MLAGIRGQLMRVDSPFPGEVYLFRPRNLKRPVSGNFCSLFRDDFQYTSLPVLVHGILVVNFVTSPGACCPASMYQCCCAHEGMTPVIAQVGSHCPGAGLNWMKIFLVVVRWSVYPWVSWNLLCRSGCPQISRDPLFLPPECWH